MAPRDDDPDASATALSARAPALRPARSMADAAPGEVLVLGRRGEVLGPRQVAWIRVRAWALMGSGVAGVGLVYGGLFSPVVGVASAAAMAALLAFRLRHWPALRAAIALASTPRWEEARAAFLALERQALPRAWRPNIQVVLGSIESLLGQPEAALARLERARSSLAGASDVNASMVRWRADASRAAVLATLGRLDEAQRVRDALVAEIAAREARTGHPRGEYFDVIIQSLDLRLAFERDAPGALPDDGTLHDWARAALARTRFGEMLVSLGWAFHRRGDDDMARHLLAEAPSRITRTSLPATAPRLHTWFEERCRVWELAPAAAAD